MDVDFRFHHGVNRLYCPSKEVAKRAAMDGLDKSQIRVFGLPIRPSFARAVFSKVYDCDCTFTCTHFLVRFFLNWLWLLFLSCFTGRVKRRA